MEIGGESIGKCLGYESTVLVDGTGGPSLLDAWEMPERASWPTLLCEDIRRGLLPRQAPSSDYAIPSPQTFSLQNWEIERGFISHSVGGIRL